MTRSPEDTLAFGHALASQLVGGEMVLLRGEIGAGKSVLARGIGEGLGVTSWQGSPTFALVHEYATAPRLYHIDLYRLTEAMVEELEIEEYVGADSALVVEWADRAPHYLGDIALNCPCWIDISVIGGGARSIVIHPPTRLEPSFTVSVEAQ